MENTKIKFLLGFVILFSIVGAYSLNKVYREIKILQDLRDNRYVMILKAHELINSMDNLTNFSRSYVVTANETYKNNYYDVMDIRDGIIERPYYYDGVYWDIIEPTRSQRHRKNTKESLYDALNKLPFEKNEFKLLEKSKKIYPTLLDLEQKALDTLDNDQDKKKAIAILYSQEYSLLKSKVMLPLDDFLFLVTKRTSIEIKDNSRTLNLSIYLLILSLFMLIMSIIFLLIHYRKKS